MTPRQRIQSKQESLYEFYNTPRPFMKYIELERELGGFTCLFEVSVKQWSEDYHMPNIESVSGLEAFGAGGHQVTNPATLNTLQTLAEGYCRENIDEIVELIEKKERE